MTYHLTTEQYRRHLAELGIAVGLPPWPEHFRAYAAARQKRIPERTGCCRTSIAELERQITLQDADIGAIVSPTKENGQ